jgi:hypothetical protein
MAGAPTASARCDRHVAPRSSRFVGVRSLVSVKQREDDERAIL